MGARATMSGSQSGSGSSSVFALPICGLKSARVSLATDSGNRACRDLRGNVAMTSLFEGDYLMPLCIAQELVAV